MRAVKLPGRMVALITVLLIALAACGGDDETTTSAGTEDGAATSTTAGDTPPTGDTGGAVVTEPDVHGGEIVISYLQQQSDLDPYASNNPASQGISQGIFDTLLRVDTDGALVGWLAESWEVSDDLLTVTMHLVEGVTFSDGTPLDAAAVIYSMDVFQDPEEYVGTTVRSMIAWEAVDDYTVEVTFAQPDVTALTLLAGTNTSIVSPTAREEMGKEAFAISPVGSGPYVLNRWEPGVEVVLERNPDYWQNDVGFADRVVWRHFADGAAAVLAAQSGEIDLLHEQEPKDVPLFEGIDGMKVGWYEGGYYSLVLNSQGPPFDVPENRQALAHAINAEAIANVAFLGFAEPGAGVLSPAEWAYDASVSPAQYDPAKAAELLAAAGNPDGFSFKVSVTPQPFRAQILEIMKADLADSGIEMEVEVNQFARHIEILTQDHAGANAGFVVQQLLPPFPEQALYIHLGCRSLVHFTGYCTPDDSTFDDLVWDATAEFDRDVRTSMVQQANQMVIDDLPIVTLVNQQNIHVWNADKLGEYSPAYGGLYNYLYLQPAQS